MNIYTLHIKKNFMLYLSRLILKIVSIFFLNYPLVQFLQLFVFRHKEKI